MASTYTSSLRLTKQGDGDNPNSWGQVLNDGVISLVDDAIAGYESITVGVSANVTLTENSGAGDQSRAAFLELTGSVGGTQSTINIIVPNQSKGYVVRNSVSYASAGADIILKVAGNTGVTIAPATNQHVICDGTSVYNVVPSEFGAITAAGAATFESTATFNSTVTVSGAGTFKGNVSVSGNIDTAGNVSVGGTQTFTGAGTFASTVTVSGAATFLSTVTVKGDVHVSSKVCASAFYGDGANLTGIVAMPTGAVVPFGGSSAPTGFLLCYGQAVSRTTYATLFGIISTTYGTGDGSTTFNLPDLRGRVVAGQDDMGGVSADRLTGQTGGVDGDTLGGSGGAETHTLTEAELASHSHGAAKRFVGSDSGTNRNSLVAAQSDIDTAFQGYETSTGGGDLLIQNTGSDSAHNNVQPTFILNYIIKT